MLPIENNALGVLGVCPPEIRDQIYDEVNNACKTGYHYAFTCTSQREKDFQRLKGIRWIPDKFKQYPLPVKAGIKNQSALAGCSKQLRSEFLARKNWEATLHLSLFLAHTWHVTYNYYSRFQMLSLYNNPINIFIDVTIERAWLPHWNDEHARRHSITSVKYCAEMTSHIHALFPRTKNFAISVSPAAWQPAFTDYERKAFCDEVNMYRKQPITPLRQVTFVEDTMWRFSHREQLGRAVWKTDFNEELTEEMLLLEAPLVREDVTEVEGLVWCVHAEGVERLVLNA